jgi:hypothetical protein
MWNVCLLRSKVMVFWNVKPCSSVRQVPTSASFLPSSYRSISAFIFFPSYFSINLSPSCSSSSRSSLYFPSSAVQLCARGYGRLLHYLHTSPSNLHTLVIFKPDRSISSAVDWLSPFTEIKFVGCVVYSRTLDTARHCRPLPHCSSNYCLIISCRTSSRMQ